MPRRTADTSIGLRALSVDELASAWGVTSRAIRKWIDIGRIPAFKVGTRVLIPIKAIETIEASTWSPGTKS